MEHHGHKWDFIIIGGGIAGLAIAELLQHSGASVLLLEKNRTLCSQSSAEQQGWFHTGVLPHVRLLDSMPHAKRSSRARVAPELANKGYCASQMRKKVF